MCRVKTRGPAFPEPLRGFTAAPGEGGGRYEIELKGAGRLSLAGSFVQSSLAPVRIGGKRYGRLNRLRRDSAPPALARARSGPRSNRSRGRLPARLAGIFKQARGFRARYRDRHLAPLASRPARLYRALKPGDRRVFRRLFSAPGEALIRERPRDPGRDREGGRR